jgi:hypothetical protein
VEGFDILDKMEEQSTPSGEPTLGVVIEDCGQLN